MEYVAIVGACYIDTILDIPTFPAEDSKLRATHHSRRRGGNAPNTAEVLAQFARRDALTDSKTKSMLQWKPALVTVLPEAGSPDNRFVRESLEGVVLDCCVERPGKQVAPTSFVLRSASSGSRTIVNFTDLEEMSLEEFKEAFNRIGGMVRWWHFEGRMPETTIQCIRHVRENAPRRTVISVEVEKPGREGLFDMALHADFVFYSRSWAMNAGFTDLKFFLESQALLLDANLSSQVKCIYCTWGPEGAGTALPFTGIPIVHTFPAAQLPFGQQVVDTVGAGDTFIAAVIAQLLGKEPMQLMDAVKALVEANEICAKKVCREGFKGLIEIENSNE